jgi:hypothetical protein
MPQLKHFARQHYEAIAAVMQSAHDHNWQTICEKLADMIKADNSGFRRERFLKAYQPDNTTSVTVAARIVRTNGLPACGSCQGSDPESRHVRCNWRCPLRANSRHARPAVSKQGGKERGRSAH